MPTEPEPPQPAAAPPLAVGNSAMPHVTASENSAGGAEAIAESVDAAAGTAHDNHSRAHQHTADIEDLLIAREALLAADRDRREPRVDARRSLNMTFPWWPRVRNLLLGGNEDYESDHRQLEILESIVPRLDLAVRDADRFLVRAARSAITAYDITNIVVLGLELPVGELLHRRVLPASAPRGAHLAIYLDERELLVAKARGWFDYDRDPAVHILHSAPVMPDDTDFGVVRERLHRGPVAIVLPDTLDRLSSAAAADLLASLKQLDNGAGVHLIATHSLDPETPAGTAAARRLEQQFATAMGTPVAFRTARAITELFAGYELVPPTGPAHTWYPEGPSPVRDDAQDLVAGIVAHTTSVA